MKSNLGLRINTLCPGVVKTNLLSSSNIEDNFGQFSQLEELKEKVLERNDFVEWVNSAYAFQYISQWKILQCHCFIYRPEDVAKASLILVTDESKNGEILKIDADGTEFISLPEPSAMRK